MYKLVAGISFLIRQFLLPNPFEVLGEGIYVEFSGEMILLSPIILNWIVGFILPVITYSIVGFYYESGSNGAWGSFLYLLFYCVHVGILGLCSLLNFAKWFVIIILLVYLFVHVLCVSKQRILW